MSSAAAIPAATQLLAGLVIVVAVDAGLAASTST